MEKVILFCWATVLFVCQPSLWVFGQNNRLNLFDTLTYAIHQFDTSCFVNWEKKGKKNPDEMTETHDKFVVSYEYPVFANPHNLAVIDSMNAAISVGCFFSMYDSVYHSISSANSALYNWMANEQVHGEFYRSNYEYKGKVKIIYQSPKVISVSNYSYISRFTFLNSIGEKLQMFDPITGQRLTLDKILKSGYESTLKKKIKNYFNTRIETDFDSSDVELMKMIKEFREKLNDDGFELPEDIALVDDGLLFSVWAFPNEKGYFKFVLPMNEIKSLLKI